MKNTRKSLTPTKRPLNQERIKTVIRLRTGEENQQESCHVNKEYDSNAYQTIITDNQIHIINEIE